MQGSADSVGSARIAHVRQYT